MKVAQAEADLAAAQSAAGGAAVHGAVAGGSRHRERAAARAPMRRFRRRSRTSRRRDADLARMRELVAKQIVSAQQLDAAQAAAARRARGRRGAAAAGGRRGRRACRTRRPACVWRRRASQAAQAARDNAQLQLSYTQVTAPETGTISKKQVEVGQLVQAGQTMMSVVADTGTWVTANFKETQLTEMHVGQPVELEVDAYPGLRRPKGRWRA